jgi:hypothetical protein
MAIVSGNFTPTTTSTAVATIPNGPCQVVLSNTSSVTVYFAVGTNAATAANGFAIPAGAPPVTVVAYPGSAGGPLNVVIASGTATGVVSWFISTTQ